MKKPYTEAQIRSFLINHIKESIINDVGGALIGWSSQVHEKRFIAGFYGVPRMLFPEIDGLGSYITGNPRSTSMNVKSYLSDIMGKKNPRYKDVAAFIVFVYRHGLLHQHDPKWFSYKRKVLGLQFTIGSPNNPPDISGRHHLEFFDNVLQLDVNTFYNDFLQSIDDFTDDVVTKYRITFNKSISLQSKPITKTELMRRNKFLTDKDFAFLTNR